MTKFRANRAPLELHCKRFLKNTGLIVRALRQEKGWTLEDTEEHGWDSWRTLQRIESGRNITLSTLWKVAKLYQTTPQEILNRAWSKIT